MARLVRIHARSVRSAASRFRSRASSLVSDVRGERVGVVWMSFMSFMAEEDSTVSRDAPTAINPIPSCGVSFRYLMLTGMLSEWAENSGA